MTEAAGRMLVEEIAPRLRVAIPRSVAQVGHEDYDELIQDALVTAAQMLSRVEAQGKQVTPGNIAYYAILHTRTGRRSTGSSKMDVMAPMTQLQGRSVVHSTEEEFGLQQADDFDGPATLGEMLTCSREDPSMEAARNLDWSELLAHLEEDHLTMLGDVARGEAITHRLRQGEMGYGALNRLKATLAEEAAEYLGADALASAGGRPCWWGDLHAEYERSACKAERR